MELAKFTKAAEVNGEALSEEIVAAVPGIEVLLEGFVKRDDSVIWDPVERPGISKSHGTITDSAAAGEVRCLSASALSASEAAAITKALRDHNPTVRTAEQQAKIANRTDRQRIRDLVGTETSELLRLVAKHWLRVMDKMDTL
jgi:hypothetical protein